MAANIQHLVVLMMENRSFDHMFGFLKSAAYPINGLNGTESNLDSAGATVVVTDDAKSAGDLKADPGHDFIDVNEQIFGNSQGTPGLAPPMSGFVKNYQSKTGNVEKSHRIMKCFKPSRYLAKLAKKYAVCDNWYSSVPGPTLPNRAFAYGATSQGRLDMSPQYLTLKTIFELLETHGVSSKIYFHDWSSVMLVGHLLQNVNKFFSPFENFFNDCENNSLPAYCFLEPRYNDLSVQGEFFPATDQHPDHSVSEGEILIKSVYDAMRANPQVWERSILVIVYDEHGGLYDHVTPPTAVRPDNLSSVAPPFRFDRLGVRVPAVIVSPYIPAGTIIGSQPAGATRVFDHTSLIATARKLFVPNYQTHWLTERDRNADTFEDCLTLANPRTDNVTAAPALLMAKAKAMLTAYPSNGNPAAQVRSRALSELQAGMVLQAHALESTLPPEDQSGLNLSSIKTEQEAAAYLALVSEKLQSGEIDTSKLPL